jgi:serine protease
VSTRANKINRLQDRFWNIRNNNQKEGRRKMKKAKTGIKLASVQLVAVFVAVFVTVMSGGVASALECMDCHVSSGITTAGAEKLPGEDAQKAHDVFLGKTVDSVSSVELDQLTATTYYVPGHYATIQEAIDAASGGDEIIVRTGNYPEHIDFLGKNITVRSEAGPFHTTISGDPDIDKYIAIVTFWDSEGADSVLDGFTITNGIGVFGGGIACYNSEPTISNCVITGNTGGSGGGIFLCDWDWDDGKAAATIVNCLITDNKSMEGGAGGGVYCGATAPTIINSTISGNSADAVGDGGGGIRSSVDASPTVFNTILWGNTAGGSPDEISVEDASIHITYSDIQGGYTDTGNIACDPYFVGNGDYHLTDSSCCIDAGTADGAPDLDIDGDSRPQGDGYEMGADEFQPIFAPGRHGQSRRSHRSR